MENMYKNLEGVKINFLRHNKNSFLATLLFSTNILIKENTGGIAYTNGLDIVFDKDIYKTLSLEQKMFILKHELEHIMHIHVIRGRSKSNPVLWNIATDLCINHKLQDEGWDIPSKINHKKKELELILIDTIDPSFKITKEDIKNLNEEGVYNKLLKNYLPQQEIKEYGLLNDITNTPATEKTDESVFNLKKFMEQATDKTIIKKISEIMLIEKKKDSNLSLHKNISHIAEYINTFLEPIVPLEELLVNFFTDLGEIHYTYKKPNRRSTEFYLPSRDKDKKRLEHLLYFIDVSGSISEKQLNIFNSELHYVFNNISPKKMTVVQFDTHITDIQVFEHHTDDFEGINIIGRGGTSLVPVREMILKMQPTAAIIFSDLEVCPMEKIDEDIPLIWIVVDNPDVEIPAGGEVFHISEDDYK